MPIYQVIVLAVIQGLTEFLPVSSSAHLVVVPKILGWPEHSLAFDVALHVGTLVAVLLYFFRDWLQIIANGLGARGGNDPQLRQNRNLLWLLVIGSIPVGIAGLLFEKKAEEHFGGLYVIGGMLIFIGILMWIADRRTRLFKDLAHVRAGDALTVGLAQAVAIIPGTSRSGITISAGLFRNFDRSTAARFSFLLSTPAIAAAAAKKAWDVHKSGGLPHEMVLPFIVGVIVSGIVGAIVIGFFMQYLRRNSLAPFVWYRVIFGIIVIALAYFRVIAA
jgi:undecaprenyl-diphosphatase